MEDLNKLAYPQKLDIDSFPKEKKPKKRKKKSRFFRRIKKYYAEWKKERRWKKKQKNRLKIGFGKRTLIFLLAPVADFLEERKREKEIKRDLGYHHRPNIFKRLYWMYLENKEEEKETKHLNRKIRKSLSFDLDYDKRVYSLKDEINHIKTTWNELPWKFSRDIENIIISTLVIVLAFSFNFLLLQTAKFSIASLFNIPSHWNNGRIEFSIPDPSPLWTYSSVVSVYISGPILLFISAIFFLHLHRKTQDKSSFLALTFLWLNLTAFVLFFGTFLAGIITDRGFGYVMGWLFIPKYIEIPLGIFSIFMIWMIGFSAGKKFIPFAPVRQFYTSPLPQTFIKFTYVYIPVIIAVGILYLIGFDNRDFTIQIVYLSIFAMLTPTLRFVPEKMQ